jgi:phytoene/squalene synthetase
LNKDNKKKSGELARQITSSSSKQADFVASLIVDKHMIDDFYRAYAYFRWADDVVDDQCKSADERNAFIKRQKKLVDKIYQGEKTGEIVAQEQMLADLIGENIDKNDLLGSYIHNVLSTLEFDAQRAGRLITEQELIDYSDYIGKGVTDLLIYSIGNNYKYPVNENRYLSVKGAHITHMLRDYVEDVQSGYINIQKEYLEAHRIDPKNVRGPEFRDWVKMRVELARSHFQEGKKYIDSVDVLAYKIMAYCYCMRFETVLDTIEKDDYILREKYNNRKDALVWLRMALMALKVTLNHFIRGKRNG